MAADEARAEPVLSCAECGRAPLLEEVAEESWRAYSDGLGELHVFCPECAEREFGAALAPRREQVLGNLKERLLGVVPAAAIQHFASVVEDLHDVQPV